MASLLATSDADLTFSISSSVGPLDTIDKPSQDCDSDDEDDTAANGDEDNNTKESRKHTQAVIARRITGLMRKVATLAQILESTNYKFALGLFLTTELQTTFSRERNYVFTSGNIVEMFESIAKTVVAPSKHDLVIVPSTARDLHFNETTKKHSASGVKNLTYTPRSVTFRDAYKKFMATPHFERIVEGLPVEVLRGIVHEDVSTSVLVLPTVEKTSATPAAATLETTAPPQAFIETLQRKKRQRTDEEPRVVKKTVVETPPSVKKTTTRKPGRPRLEKRTEFSVNGPNGHSHVTTLIVDNDNSHNLHRLIDHMQTNGLEIDIEGIVADTMKRSFDDENARSFEKHSNTLFDMMMHGETPALPRGDVTTSVNERRRFLEELSAEASKLPKSQHVLETIKSIGAILALPDSALDNTQVERGVSLAIECVGDALSSGQLAIYGGVGFAVAPHEEL